MKQVPITKLLIANRGEIVRRIGRTCRRLGIPAATVHSVADRDALHVRDIGESVEIGAAPSSQSYLNIDAIIAAAHAVGANAIHPGIGFLSEDPAFAQRVADEGLIFVGPTPDLLSRFGDKWAAKKEAKAVNVRVIEGSDGSLNDPAEIEALIRGTMTLPVVLKAAAGGGGRGVRIVRELDGLGDTIQSAMREATSAFGRGDMIVEEFIENARHVEVQVAGDGNGNAIHLFERECSLQRRFQKIVEEAPATYLPADLREKILADAVRLAANCNYLTLGTVEFLVSGGNHYFLECNPRLQVEHTCTEEVTGVDLVELQLFIATNHALPIAQDAVRCEGHAMQVRIYAENSAAGFMPSTGMLDRVAFPSNVRVETGVATGSEVTPHYDAMIAKLIVKAPNRVEAIALTRNALADTIVVGVDTNIAFLDRLLQQPEVIAGTTDNRYIDRNIAELTAEPVPTPADVAKAAAIWWHSRAAPAGLGRWAAQDLKSWRYADSSEGEDGTPDFLLVLGDTRFEVRIGHRDPDGAIRLTIDGTPLRVGVRREQDQRFAVTIDGLTHLVTATISNDRIAIHDATGSLGLSVAPFLLISVDGGLGSGVLVAPMVGAIQRVIATVGQKVVKGELLIVEESMKMELPIIAPADATVIAIHCAAGDVVERNQVLIELEPDEGH